MSDILNTIAENTRLRYEKIIAEKPFDEIKSQALALERGEFEFEKALEGDELSFVCEIKK